MEYTIHQLASLAGISTRTLRYYHSLGLLAPHRVTPAGYRVYGIDQVDRLQQILFYRELGFELSAIKAALDDPDFERSHALERHLEALCERREQLNGLIATVQKTIESMKGGTNMPDSEKFECFKRRAVAENEEKYGAEARARYGDKAVEESNRKFENMNEEAYKKMTALGEEIQNMLEAAVRAGTDPAGPEARSIAAKHKDWLQFTLPSYSKEVHRGLGEMYVADERFTAYYDKNMRGCAVFLRDAISAYTSEKNK